jgi:hypothetical protein
LTIIGFRSVWKLAKTAVVAMHCQSPLLQVVIATHTPGCLTGGLNSREKQAYKNPDDCNHNEKFYERESPSYRAGGKGTHGDCAVKMWVTHPIVSKKTLRNQKLRDHSFARSMGGHEPRRGRCRQACG